MARPLHCRCPMLRQLAIALAAITTTLGCDGGDAGVDPDPDDCANRGCASFPGTLTLTVLDSASGAPVPGDISFEAEIGGDMPFACSAVVEPGEPCPSWLLSIQGRFDLAVSAPGYQTGFVEVLIEGPAGCCGTGPDTEATVELDPS